MSEVVYEFMSDTELAEIERQTLEGVCVKSNTLALVEEVKKLNGRMWFVNERIDYVATQIARSHYGTREGVSDEEMEEFQSILRELVL